MDYITVAGLTPEEASQNYTAIRDADPGATTKTFPRGQWRGHVITFNGVVWAGGEPGEDGEVVYDPHADVRGAMDQNADGSFVHPDRAAEVACALLLRCCHQLDKAQITRVRKTIDAETGKIMAIKMLAEVLGVAAPTSMVMAFDMAQDAAENTEGSEG